jgi:signal transduction histidine kinase
MNQIQEFFAGLFSTDQWPARWHCGNWTSFHGWLYIISDLMIWLAYFMIPVIIIWYFAGKKNLINYRSVYLLFAAFILLCGATHFLDAMMFWIPMYRLNALVRLATGIVSLFTVYRLIQILPEVFRQKTNKELEREIFRRTEAELKLGEANLSLEAYAYMASHDLQEPIRKISTFAEMLYEKNKDNADTFTLQLTEKIIASSARMQSMVKDLLTLGTLSSVDNFEKVKLEEALQPALQDLELKIKERGVRIEVGDLPFVYGNKQYLAQVFLNLLSNSIKFSKTDPLIQITAKKDGDRVFVYIKDNGIGMSAENLQRIFVAFERLHGRSEYEGSGIGLAICRRIIQLHKGNIFAESTLNGGSTFVFDLPAAQ